MSLGRARECRRLRKLAGANRQLAFWSSPARRSAVESSAFLPNTGVAGFAGFYLPGLSPHARSDGAAAFGDRKISFVRKVCENDKNFWKNFVFFAKIGNNRPNFS